MKCKPKPVWSPLSTVLNGLCDDGYHGCSALCTNGFVYIQIWFSWNRKTLLTVLKNKGGPFKVMVAIKEQNATELSAAAGGRPGRKTDSLMQPGLLEIMLEKDWSLFIGNLFLVDVGCLIQVWLERICWTHARWTAQRLRPRLTSVSGRRCKNTENIKQIRVHTMNSVVFYYILGTTWFTFILGHSLKTFVSLLFCVWQRNPKRKLNFIFSVLNTGLLHY